MRYVEVGVTVVAAALTCIVSAIRLTGASLDDVADLYALPADLFLFAAALRFGRHLWKRTP